ncbi:hypothetical protein DMENIID0001_123920 [Sergentomyia squamirostris]
MVRTRAKSVFLEQKEKEEIIVGCPDFSEHETELYLKLIDKLLEILPENDERTHTMCLSRINWEQIQVDGFSPQSSLKDKLTTLLKRIRIHKNLREMLLTAKTFLPEENIPVRKTRRCSAFNLFLKENFAKIREENTRLSVPEVNKEVSKRFFHLDQTQRESYTKKAMVINNETSTERPQNQQDLIRTDPRTPIEFFISKNRAKNPNKTLDEFISNYKDLPSQVKVKYINNALNLAMVGLKPEVTKEELRIFHEYEGRPKYPLPAFTMFWQERGDSGKGLKQSERIRIWRELPKEEKQKFLEDFAKRKKEYDVKMKEFFSNLSEERLKLDKALKRKYPKPESSAKNPQTPVDFFIEQRRLEGCKQLTEQMTWEYNLLSDEKKVKYILQALNLAKTGVKPAVTKTEMSIFDEHEGRPQYPLTAFAVFLEEHGKGKTFTDCSKLWQKLPAKERQHRMEDFKQRKKEYDEKIKKFMRNLSDDRLDLEKVLKRSHSTIKIAGYQEDPEKQHEAKTPMEFFIKEKQQRKRKIKTQKQLILDYKDLPDDTKAIYIQKAVEMAKIGVKPAVTKDEIRILHEFEGRPKYPAAAYPVFCQEQGRGPTDPESLRLWKEMPAEEKQRHMNDFAGRKKVYNEKLKIFLKNLPEDRLKLEKTLNKRKRTTVRDDSEDRIGETIATKKRKIKEEDSQVTKRELKERNDPVSPKQSRQRSSRSISDLGKEDIPPILCTKNLKEKKSLAGFKSKKIKIKTSQECSKGFKINPIKDGTTRKTN